MREQAFFDRFSNQTIDPSIHPHVVLVQSVLQEIQRILTARRSVEKDSTLPKFFPQCYGLPDFQNIIDMTDQKEWLEIKKTFESVLLTYEPRIKSIFLQIQSFDVDTQTLYFDGTFALYNLSKIFPLSFKLLLSNRSLIFM